MYLSYYFYNKNLFAGVSITVFLNIRLINFFLNNISKTLGYRMTDKENNCSIAQW